MIEGHDKLTLDFGLTKAPLHPEIEVEEQFEAHGQPCLLMHGLLSAHECSQIINVLDDEGGGEGGRWSPFDILESEEEVEQMHARRDAPPLRRDRARSPSQCRQGGA